jgi:hypothetical protein
MPISDRIEATLESWSTKWNARLKSWLGSVLGWGIEVFADALAKSLARRTGPVLDQLLTMEKLPPEVKTMLQEAKTVPGEGAASLLAGLGGRITGAATTDFLGAFMRELSYEVNRKIPTVQPDPLSLIAMGRRKGWAKDVTLSWMRNHGWGTTWGTELYDLTEVRFPSQVVGPVWLHDKARWEKYWDDVRANGVTEDRIELLKEELVKYPSPAEAVRWMAREVFEPEMAAKYGLDDEFDKIDLDFMGKVGITPEIAKNHWRAHWEHASWSQVVQMLHRGALTEQDIYDWFRLVEIPPYWRKGLTATMWELPGRVEARMLAQYGLVDKPWLVKLLESDGLAKEYRDVVADMMLVRGIRTDIQTRYAKGWLNAQGVRQEIETYGLSEGIATRLYQWIVKNGAGDRTSGEKDISKTEIVKAYKQAQIDHEEAVQMLVDLGYDELEADFILAVNAEVPTETPTETQRVNIDTIRRSRRLRKLTHDEEMAALLALNVDSALAKAYADNDDLRLVKA